MGRPSMRYLVPWVLALTVATFPAMGCRGVLATAMLLFKGTDIPPDFAELKGKKVAVVCRPVVSLQYRNANVARDLAQQVTVLLQNKVPKIKTIDQRKVAKWADENTWEEYTEVGKAMKADMVVGIDLEGFNLFQGQTTYQGKADATIRVYDCREGGKVAFEKIMPQCVFPPNIGIPTSDLREADFRREFVTVLADQVARHFYAHDPHADLAQDAAVLK
jgi:hypothetical protein